MATRGEIRSLTGLRGVAACLVMLYHLGGHQLGVGPARTFIEHGYLWVDLFLVLSGFVLALTYTKVFVLEVGERAYRKFILERIIRIFPLLWCVTLLVFAKIMLGFHVGAGSHAPISGAADASIWWAFASNMLLIQAWGIGDSLVGPAWSLSTEWALSLAFPFLVVLLLRGSPWRSYLAVGLAVIALASLALLPTAMTGAVRVRGPLDMATGSNYAPMLRCVADFILGMAAFRAWGHEGLRRAAAGNWLSATAAVGILVLMAIPDADLAIVLLFPPLVISVSVASPVVARLLGAGPVRFLGKISYSIYLTHTVVALAQPHLLRALLARGVPGASYIVVAVLIGASIAVAMVTYRVIEVGARARLRQWLTPARQMDPLAAA